MAFPRAALVALVCLTGVAVATVMNEAPGLDPNERLPTEEERLAKEAAAYEKAFTLQPGEHESMPMHRAKHHCFEEHGGIHLETRLSANLTRADALSCFTTHPASGCHALAAEIHGVERLQRLFERRESEVAFPEDGVGGKAGLCSIGGFHFVYVTLWQLHRSDVEHGVWGDTHSGAEPLDPHVEEELRRETRPHARHAHDGDHSDPHHRHGSHAQHQERTQRRHAREIEDRAVLGGDHVDGRTFRHPDGRIVELHPSERVANGGPGHPMVDDDGHPIGADGARVHKPHETVEKRTPADHDILNPLHPDFEEPLVDHVGHDAHLDPEKVPAEFLHDGEL